jgi:MYXO-CTERM domain-containing protein
MFDIKKLTLIVSALLLPGLGARGDFVAGNAMVLDDDGDGVLRLIDNALTNPNPSQADADGDGIGDDEDYGADPVADFQLELTLASSVLAPGDDLVFTLTSGSAFPTDGFLYLDFDGDLTTSEVYYAGFRYAQYSDTPFTLSADLFVAAGIWDLNTAGTYDFTVVVYGPGIDGGNTVSSSVTVVPEPGATSLATLGLGVVLLGVWRRRRAAS